MHYGLWIGGGVSAILAVGIALVIRALRALERELKHDSAVTRKPLF